MGTLYIVGNGLDIHYGLKTKVEHFQKILETKGVYGEIGNAIDVLAAYGVDWSGYEEALADIDLSEIELQNLISPDYLSDHESDRDGGILNMQMYLESINEAIQSSLKEMAEIANRETEERGANGEQYTLPKVGDAILSFNYTSTIENLFIIPQSVPICHIHGFYENGDPLIFGYSDMKLDYIRGIEPSIEDWDYYEHMQREAICDFYYNWRKTLQIEKLRNFLDKCHGIDEVCVLGHGLGKVDSAYMEEIEQRVHPKVWKIFYHGDRDIVLHNIQRYSFVKKAQYFPW